MADDRERLILEMSADLKRFEKGLDRATSIGEKRLSQIERRFDKAGRQMSASMTSGAANINRAIAGIAVGAAIREVGQYADAWTNAGNKLAAAGVPAQALAGRQRELLTLANETRTALEPTVDLYARLTRSTESIGASSANVARVTEITNKAFKAGGAAAQEQAAGILQLGQALGSGVLQGDELRSLRENAPLIAKAIADEFGTTIGGLKKLGAEGKLTSDRVFAAIIAGGAAIDAQFARTTPTIADSFTILRNEATGFIGTLDRATGASKQLSLFIVYVSENLGALAQAAVVAAAVVGGVLAGNAVIALVAALTKAAVSLGVTSAALSAMGARAVAATAATNALKAGLAFFGGPIGIAITGIAIAFSLLAVNAGKSAIEAKLLSDTIEQQAAAASTAADEQANLTGQISAGMKWAAGLTGQTDLLADAHYRAAAAAKAQAIEEARLRLATANNTLTDARDAFEQRRRIYGQTTVSTPYGSAVTQGGSGFTPEGDRRAVQTEEYKNLSRQVATVKSYTASLNALMAARLEDARFKPPTFTPTGGSDSGGGGKGGRDAEASAKAAAEEAKRNRESLVSIAEANSLEVARLTANADLVASLEREQQIRERISAYESAGVATADATSRAAADQLSYDQARQTAIDRALDDRRAGLDLEIAASDQAFEQVRALERVADLKAAIKQYEEDGLTTAKATTAALLDQIRLEAARDRARARYLAEAQADRQQRLAELRGETQLANQLARGNEIRTRSRGFQDSGGMSPAAADARASAEVLEETRARAQGAFRDAFRNGVLEAIRSGDVLAAIGEFSLEAAGKLTDQVLNQAADALFDLLSTQFPKLFDLGAEIAADTTAATTMAASITTSGAAAGAAMAAAITTAGGAAALAMGAAIAAAGGTSSTAQGIGAAISSAFAGGRAVGGGVRKGALYTRNEQGAEPFVPTTNGVVFSTQAMRGLASLGKLAGQGGGGMGGDLHVEVINQTGVPVKTKQEKTPGGARVTLQPMFEKALEGSGRSGALKKAASMSPPVTKRG